MQANSCADVDYVYNCGTSGNSDMFVFYLYKYIHWGVHFLHKEIGL
jgi:hypothetical protein